MDDIRLFETDGDYLVLEAQDGQKYRLLVDDTVRSSVKNEPRAQLDAIDITPREIQEEIRNGATIQELIDRSGATFDFIEKFAAPVIAELDHIVSSALTVRLTIAGDRYNDSTQIEFGEIIAGRLVTSGATGISWVAKKIEPNNWNITANFLLNGVAGSATWSFDPRRLTLSPESETAVTLSSQETLNNGPTPKLRPVEPNISSFVESAHDSVSKTAVPETAVPETAVPETVAMDDVIPFNSRMETPIALEERPEPSTPAAFKRPSEQRQEDSRVEEPLSATADLLEALRRKRTEREETNLEPHPETSNIRVIDFEPADVVAPVLDDAPTQIAVEAENVNANEEQKPARKGRAAMPSWDEIVFGTKADD